MILTDAAIIDAIQKGNDRQALEYLYKKLFPKIKKYICENSGNADVAYDIFQESILVFYQYVKTDRFDRNHDIAGFMYTVGKNMWINSIMKNKRMSEMPERFDQPDTRSSALEMMITHERENKIKEVMDMLGEKCRQLLTYSVFYKLRNAEICTRMGFSTENAVKTQKYKCMQKLQTLLTENPALKQELQNL